MTRTTRRHSWLGDSRVAILATAMLPALIASGCGGGSASPPPPAVPAAGKTSQPAITRTAGAIAASAPATLAAARPLRGAAAEPPAKTAADAIPAEPFKPPFGHRTNPFRIPAINQTATAPSDLASSSSKLELKGFVAVSGRSRALLAINDQIAAVAEGQRFGGVTVVSVSPPEVTLQRGRRRWSLTLLKHQANRETGERTSEPVEDGGTR